MWGGVDPEGQVIERWFERESSHADDAADETVESLSAQPTESFRPGRPYDSDNGYERYINDFVGDLQSRISDRTYMERALSQIKSLRTQDIMPAYDRFVREVGSKFEECGAQIISNNGPQKAQQLRDLSKFSEETMRKMEINRENLRLFILEQDANPRGMSSSAKKATIMEYFTPAAKTAIIVVGVMAITAAVSHSGISERIKNIFWKPKKTTGLSFERFSQLIDSASKAKSSAMAHVKDGIQKTVLSTTGAKVDLAEFSNGLVSAPKFLYEFYARAAPMVANDIHSAFVKYTDPVAAPAAAPAPKPLVSKEMGVLVGKPHISKEIQMLVVKAEKDLTATTQSAVKSAAQKVAVAEKSAHAQSDGMFKKMSDSATESFNDTMSNAYESCKDMVFGTSAEKTQARMIMALAHEKAKAQYGSDMRKGSDITINFFNGRMDKANISGSTNMSSSIKNNSEAIAISGERPREQPREQPRESNIQLRGILGQASPRAVKSAVAALDGMTSAYKARLAKELAAKVAAAIAANEAASERSWLGFFMGYKK